MSLIPPSAIALFAVFFYNCANAIFGYLTNVVGISTLQLMATQTIPGFLSCVIYTLTTSSHRGLLCPPGTRIHIGSIALLAPFGSLLVMSTLHQLTLSEHVTVMCILPFLTAFLARIWLGEVFTKTRATCCVLCMAGVIIITDPFRLRENETAGHGQEDGIPDTVSGKLIGIGLTLLGACFTAPQFVLMRVIGDRASAAQIKTVTYLSMSLALSTLMLVTDTPIVVPSSIVDWLLLGGLAVTGLVAECSIAYAGQRTSPTTVTICVYAGVVFSNIMQWLIYGNHPSPVAFTGMAIVLTAGLYGVIYGPSNAGSAPSDPERTLLLPDEQESGTSGRNST